VEDFANEVGLTNVWIEDSAGGVRSEAKTMPGTHEQDRDRRVKNPDDVAEFQRALNVALHVYNDSVIRHNSIEFLASVVDGVNFFGENPSAGKSFQIDTRTITIKEDRGFHDSLSARARNAVLGL
jgi:hypothetical protein